LTTRSNHNVLQTRQITEIAVLLAMAVALELIATFLIPRQPQGGSISISMIPLVVIVYRNGFKIGLFASLVFGLLNWMIAGFVVYVVWTEVILDYFLAYGVAAFSYFAFTNIKDKALGFTIGMILAGVFRYVMHYISGIFIFDVFAPDDQPLWLYSLTYNGAYMIPTIVLMGLIAPLIYTKLYEWLH